jgi:hypothetical protein
MWIVNRSLNGAMSFEPTDSLDIVANIDIKNASPDFCEKIISLVLVMYLSVFLIMVACSNVTESSWMLRKRLKQTLFWCVICQPSLKIIICTQKMLLYGAVINSKFWISRQSINSSFVLLQLEKQAFPSKSLQKRYVQNIHTVGLHAVSN